MAGPTVRQAAVLDFVRAYIAKHKRSPSLEEIGKGVGLTALSTVNRHLNNLADKGLVRWRRGFSRSVEVLDVCPVCHRAHQ
jgi:repressor LexA